LWGHRRLEKLLTTVAVAYPYGECAAATPGEKINTGTIIPILGSNNG